MVLAGSGGTILLVTALLGLGASERARGLRALTPAVSEAASPTGSPPSGSALPSLPALFDTEIGLRAGPVSVPLELLLPSLETTARVLGVGITPTDVMDAPMGPAEDPVWQQAFWYRGSAVPGAPSTAVIAGHANDPLGRPAVFAHIDQLRPDDPIVVRDNRSGLEVRFTVTASTAYPLAATTDPAVLTRIYGAGPVEGAGPQPSADGLSHLTLITCAGTFRNGTHDQRLVVYATRTA